MIKAVRQTLPGIEQQLPAGMKLGIPYDSTAYIQDAINEVLHMGWVMRAHDAQNYVAMKFNVLSPGLRPVISMAHYPVHNGRKGVKTETPLSVMVHNNTAYHVEVAVTKNHFAVSIEGEEVDSWTDDTPASGGVGFFSEATEQARLYWVKVYKNDDWLGRLCGFFTGGAAGRSGDTARLAPVLVPVQAALWTPLAVDFTPAQAPR